MTVNRPMNSYTNWKSADDNFNYSKCTLCIPVVVLISLQKHCWTNADCDNLIYFV